jgi:hypothetical protein
MFAYPFLGCLVFTARKVDPNGPLKVLQPPRKRRVHVNPTSSVAQHESISERTSSLSSDALKAMEERPYTCLAIAGGLAFAIGALWAIKRQHQQSRFERLFAHGPSLSRHSWWKDTQMPSWSRHSWWRDMQMPSWSRHSWWKDAQMPSWSRHSWWRDAQMPSWSRHSWWRDAQMPSWVRNRWWKRPDRWF